MSEMPIIFDEKAKPEWPLSVPMSVLYPHREQAQINHQQALERLAQRGGLSPREMLAVLEDRPWSKVEIDVAMARISMILGQHGWLL